MESRSDLQERARQWWIEPELRIISRRYDSRQTAMMPKAIAQMAINLSDATDSFSVLDIGCGRGSLLAELGLHRPAWSLVGLDPDPEAQHDRVEGDFRIIKGAADDAPQLAQSLTSPTLITAMLTIALWDDPTTSLGRVLDASSDNTFMLVFDLLRPVDELSLTSWQAFAGDSEELRYLTDQANAWLGLREWADLVTTLSLHHPAWEIQLAQADVRFLGMSQLEWSTEYDKILNQARDASSTTGILMRMLPKS